MAVKKKIWLVLALFALVGGSVAVVFYLVGERGQRGDIKIIPEHVDIQVKDVVYKDVSQSGMKWEVRAEKGSYGRLRDEARLEGVHVKLIMPDGRTYIMTGDQGVFKSSSRDMTLAGHVVVTSDTGDRITMDDISYQPKERVLATDSTVILENDRMRLSGRGMRIAMDKRELKLLSGVSAVVKAR